MIDWLISMTHEFYFMFGISLQNAIRGLALAPAEIRCRFSSFDSIERRDYEQRCLSALTKEAKRLLNGF
jgi:hypothetical protein